MSSPRCALSFFLGRPPAVPSSAVPSSSIVAAAAVAVRPWRSRSRLPLALDPVLPQVDVYRGPRWRLLLPLHRRATARHFVEDLIDDPKGARAKLAANAYSMNELVIFFTKK